MKENHIRLYTILLCCISALAWLPVPVAAQNISREKSISITIDDVPNLAGKESRPGLLQVLDSLDIPFTIFINEARIFRDDDIELNKRILASWIENDKALIGNHTFSHMRYSSAEPDEFIRDIGKGEALSSVYALENGKELKYFRFPFNDLGKDSVQQVLMRKHLSSMGYIIAPFTVESSDWMFNAVYSHYLKAGEVERARKIGQLYVDKTIEMVLFFENLAQEVYNRPVRQIYLCHDNSLNTDYLDEIIRRLHAEDYRIISFSESLTDPVYEQENTYYQKWGISWLYRWMGAQPERAGWMKQEPDLTEIQQEYDEIRANEGR